MANYVFHRVVCSQETFERYFWDEQPFGEKGDAPYITFNQLVGVPSLTDYIQEFGVSIYYGYGFIYRPVEDGQIEMLFATRWYHPIKAIEKAVELDHHLVWYAVEENVVYVSKFYWDGGIREDVYVTGDTWDDWYEENVLYEENYLEDADSNVWTFLSEVEAKWVEWTTADGFQRYFQRQLSMEELAQVCKLSRALDE